MKKPLSDVFIVLLSSSLLFADAGVLIPRDKQQPNPAILSLEEMEITVRIDNGDARVFVRQIFACRRSFWSANGRKKSITNSSSRQSIRDCCKWENAVQKRRNGLPSSARGSYRFPRLEPSGLRSSTTSPSRLRI